MKINSSVARNKEYDSRCENNRRQLKIRFNGLPDAKMKFYCELHDFAIILSLFGPYNCPQELDYDTERSRASTTVVSHNSYIAFGAGKIDLLC